MITKSAFNQFTVRWRSTRVLFALSGGFGLLLFWCACPGVAAVYKWVDAQGLVHYSDEPEAGAKRITLPELSIVPYGIPAAPLSESATPRPSESAPTAPLLTDPLPGTAEPQETETLPTPSSGNPSMTPEASAGTEPGSDADLHYPQLAIQVPANNQTLTSSTAQLDIELALQPELRNSDRIQLFLDGRLFRDELRSTRFTISGFTPGSHILEVRVVSPEGKTLRRSKSILFHYQP